MPFSILSNAGANETEHRQKKKKVRARDSGGMVVFVIACIVYVPRANVPCGNHPKTHLNTYTRH